MSHVSSPAKVAIMAGLILLAVSSFAAYSKYTEPQSRFGVGQTKTWIFGEPIYGYARYVCVGV